MKSMSKFLLGDCKVMVNNVNLAIELENLSYFIQD